MGSQTQAFAPSRAVCGRRSIPPLAAKDESMNKNNNRKAKFVNRYGEEWMLEYDASTGESILKGSDVGWQPCRVVGGHAVGLLLNDEELIWLRAAWAAATMN